VEETVHNRRETGKSSAAARRAEAQKRGREAKLSDRMKRGFIGRLLYRRPPAGVVGRLGAPKGRQRRRRPWRQEASVQKKLKDFV